MKSTNRKMYSSRIADKFVVRLPEGWREQIAAFAKTNRRSMNSHILSYIEAGLLLESADQPNSEKALLEAFNAADADPHGSIVAVQSPRVPYGINIPVMYDDYAWLVVALHMQDGRLWADLERIDTDFKHDNGRRCATCLHGHLEPYCA